jgi:protein SCO1/2
MPESDDADWHYWTGTAPAIAEIERAVGFRAQYDARLRQFTHPAGLVVLTRDGIVSGYLLGLGYQPGATRAAVARAALGTVDPAASPILLLCFHFDASSGRYTLSIEKMLRLMALLTILTFAGVLVALHRARRP